MNYKHLDSYKKIMKLGIVDDITDVYKSKKESIAFQPKGQDPLNPKHGDRRFIIQKSGYIRYPVYVDKTNAGGSTTWDMNGKVIERFEKWKENYYEIGLSLLLIYFLKKTGNMSLEESYREKMLADSHGYINSIFINYFTNGWDKEMKEKNYNKFIKNFHKSKWKSIYIFTKDIK